MEINLNLNPGFTTEKTRSATTNSTVQPYVYACVFSSVCIVTGLFGIFPGTRALAATGFLHRRI